MELPKQNLNLLSVRNILSAAMFLLLIFLTIPPLYAQAYIYNQEAKEWRLESDPDGPAYGNDLSGTWRRVDEFRREMEVACKKKGTFEQYYQECIIDKMQSVRSGVAHAEAQAYCAKKAPCAWVKSKRGGVFGVNSANKCFEKYGAPNRYAAAAQYIRDACYELYEDK